MRRIVRLALVIWATLSAPGALAPASADPDIKAGSLGDPKGFFTPSIVPGFRERLEGAGDLLSESDKAAFDAAYNAANRRDWARALSLATRIRHGVAAKTITWAYLTADETNPAFDEIMRFLDDNPGWPMEQSLLEKAERSLPETMPPARLIAWFAGQEPLTGEGMFRLAEAMFATGKKDYGSRWLALAWSVHDFPGDKQREIFAKYKDYLKGQPTTDRIEHLLWSYQYEQAEWLLPQLPDDKRRFAEARIALMKQARNAMAIVQALPKGQREDPAIIFDQVRYQRRAGNDDAALDLLLTLDDPEKAPYPERWWIERNYQARNALDAEKYEKAYRVLARTGLTEGASFADAEWLAGWIALRFLKRPQTALKHFEKLEAGVTYPISLARAHYWAGRAAQAMGDPARAATAYAEAAQFPYTFYGQLGAESSLLSNQQFTLPATPQVDPARWASFINDELVTAIRLLDEIDGERYMRTLGYHLADKAQGTDDLVLLAELFREIGKIAISVRIAKRASQQHLLLTDYLYPLVEIPEYRGTRSAPEPALVLGLARQESEFNPGAVSSAGARGLMQLMPSTAEITARKNGLPYRSSALTQDPTYNMQIGMAHVADLLADYNGSYILVAAAYNAGAQNVNRWIARMGDPRTKGIDPVDWIEGIPFTETRNYVQRVLENAVVYRQRIAGRPINFTLATDLRRTSQTPLDLSYLKPAASAAPAAPSAPDQAGENIEEPSSATPAPRPESGSTTAGPTQSFAPAPADEAMPGSLGVPPAILPPEDAPEPIDGEGTSGTVVNRETPAPFDRNWKIPADCGRFIIRPDQSAECID